MRFADLERITWSPCFVKLVQWRQVMFDPELSLLFFLGLVLVGGFGPGTTAEVTTQSCFLPHSFPLYWESTNQSFK